VKKGYFKAVKAQLINYLKTYFCGDGKVGRFMYDGKQLWASRIPLQMERREVGGRVFDTYVDLPENLYVAMLKSVDVYPDKAAIVDDDGTKITYHRLLEMVDCLAYRLRTEMDVKKGDHVALMLYSGAAFCVSFLAALKLGAVTLPLPSKFRQDEVMALLKKSDAKLIICNKDFAGWMEPLAEKGVKLFVTGHLASELETGQESDGTAYRGADAKDPAILMYTSGTTSLSKGVVLSNFNVMHAVETYRLLLGITPEDRTVIGVPIYHVTGMIALLSLFLYAGGTTYLHKRFDAKRILQCVVDDSITFMHGSPSAFSLLLKEKDAYPALPSLRMVACGSSYMPKEKILAFHQWLPETEFRTVYGMTETSSPATVFPCAITESVYIASCGIPIPGLTFRIVNESGEELPAQQVGEVQMKGSVVLREYYHMRTPELSEDGWLSTGDMGYFNEEGYLFLVDRKKDMINRGGEKICSYDVEHALYKLPGIEDAAVVGIPDDIYGEAAAAAVVWRGEPALTEAEIKKRLLEKMARYKVPVRILSVERLPFTPNGKIDKKEIKSWFSGGGGI